MGSAARGGAALNRRGTFVSQLSRTLRPAGIARQGRRFDGTAHTARARTRALLPLPTSDRGGAPIGAPSVLSILSVLGIGQKRQNLRPGTSEQGTSRPALLDLTATLIRGWLNLVCSSSLSGKFTRVEMGDMRIGDLGD